MASATTSQLELLTVEQLTGMPDPGYPFELVRGRILRVPPASFRHGLVCVRIVVLIEPFVRRAGLGRLVSNDSGIVTERDPDTLRGVDVAYFSFARLPQNVVLQGYPDVVPEIAFEVRSPSDRQVKILEKVAEYLNAGVIVVCVLDPETQTIVVYRADAEAVRLMNSEEFALADVLPGFACRVGEFFE